MPEQALRLACRTAAARAPGAATRRCIGRAIHALISRAEDRDNRCTALSGHCNISRHVADFAACPSSGGGMRLEATAHVSAPRASPLASVSAAPPSLGLADREARYFRPQPLNDPGKPSHQSLPPARSARRARLPTHGPVALRAPVGAECVFPACGPLPRREPC